MNNNLFKNKVNIIIKLKNNYRMNNSYDYFFYHFIFYFF